MNDNIAIWAIDFPWMNKYGKDIYDNDYDDEEGCDSECLPEEIEYFLSYIEPNDRYFDPEQFYDLRPWEFLEIGKEQYKTMADIYNHVYELSEEDFTTFLSHFLNAEARTFTDICVRTKYAIIMTLYWNKVELFDYNEWMGIAKHTEMEELEHVLQLYSDLKFSLKEIDNFNKYISSYNSCHDDVINADEYLVDISLYEKHIKLSNLKDLHDKTTRKAAECQRIVDEFENEALEKDITESVNSEAYKQFLYSDDTYSVIGVKNGTDLDNEGEVLNHCVGSYKSALAKGDSFIYFIRSNEKIDIPLFTAEIISNRSTFILNQCYGLNDTIDKPQEMADFIKKWSKRKGFKIGCEI